jgi:non-specific serine/threonine protein kinase
MRYAAIALFVDRAQSLAAGFTLSDDNAPTVAEICRRLDGIPLAIELAATRVNAMSLPRLAQSLDNRFKVLIAGNRTALPRHQTLRALIDWSYDLLTGEEQRLLNLLGIFAAGFGPDAATAVCAGDGVDRNRVCEVLASLVDKSLVVADIGGASERYRLLESTRVYALQRLADDERARVSRRHAEYFCDEAVAADSCRRLGPTARFLASLEMEPQLDNYRAALEWALTSGGDPKLGGTLAGALSLFWLETAPAEGLYWVRRAQAILDESALPIVAGRLWFALSALSVGTQRLDCAQRAFSFFESAGDDYWAAWARYYVAAAFYQIGRFDEAAEESTRALELMRGADQYGIPVLLAFAAFITWHRQDNAEARKLYAQALDACKALGDEREMGAILLNLAELEFVDGNVERALSLGGVALEMCRRYKRARCLAVGNNNIAVYCIALGDVEKARDALWEVLHFARRQDAPTFAIALQHVALVGALSGQALNAARLIGYVNLQFEQLGYRREYIEQWSYEKLVAALRGQMGDPEIETLAAEGAQWSEERATEEALKLSDGSARSGSP